LAACVIGDAGGAHEYDLNSDTGFLNRSERLLDALVRAIVDAGNVNWATNGYADYSTVVSNAVNLYLGLGSTD
jgi:hypothetical protein